MGIINRVKRKAGCDTTKQVTKRKPVYEYTLSFVDDTTEVVEAAGHGSNESILYLSEHDDVIPGFLQKQDVYITTSRVYECGAGAVKEIDGERIGDKVFEVTVDEADGSLVEWDSRFEESV